MKNEKPTFGQLCTTHQVTAEQLLQASGLREEIISALFLHNYCSRERIAGHALHALNTLANTSYTLADISISFSPPEAHHRGGYSALYGPIFHRPSIKPSRTVAYSDLYGDLGAARRRRPAVAEMEEELEERGNAGIDRSLQGRYDRQRNNE
jgi:hypothetical protein